MRYDAEGLSEELLNERERRQPGSDRKSHGESDRSLDDHSVVAGLAFVVDRQA